MNIATICSLALITAFVVVFINQYRPEFSSLTITAASAIILTVIAKNALPLINQYLGIAKNGGISSELFTIIIKSVGISYMTVFTSDLCKDFGQNSLCSKVEMAGKISVIIIASPLIIKIIEITSELI